MNSTVDESPPQVEYDSASLEVTNVGGIDECNIEFDPGVTLLTGPNATNRTSLLRALNGVLGGTAATRKTDAEEGYVKLSLEDEEYTRTYTSLEVSAPFDERPYTDEETLVDLFVSLLEDNPARQAVKRQEDLREIIMRPVDTDEIDQHIRDLKEEQKRIEDELKRMQERRDELPKLANQRDELEDKIVALDGELDELRDEVSDFEADASEVEEAESLVDELDDRRQELSKVEDEIEVTEAELDALRETLEDVSDELEDLPSETGEELSTIENELESVRERKRDLDGTIDSLTTIIGFNEDILTEDSTALPGIKSDNESVVEDLAPEETREMTCWTCGSGVEYSTIEERLDDLRELVTERRNRRSELVDEIESLEERRKEITQQQSSRRKLERELEETEEKIDHREQQIDELEERAGELREEIEDLETEVAETKGLRNSDLLDKYEKISELQYERGQLKQQLEDVEDDIDEIESLPSKGDLEDQRAELTNELEQERSRITELESESIDAFNEHMEDIIDVLQYENLARVWIEQKKHEKRGTMESSFHLHIIREGDSGEVYEDTVDNLSESEREVVGLVLALAGYLVHGVYERVPFMLLDSVEAIDADRIAEMVTYFADYAPFLVVALLPEDAQALPEEYTRLDVNT